MGNFRRDNKRSDGGFNRGFGGGQRFGGGGRDGGRPTMHKATCSECGDDCEIPFRPTGSRPVFCSDCFANQDNKGGGRSDKFNSERRGRSSFGEDRQMHDACCAKCGEDCQVPFRPTASKPVYCSDCFGQDKRSGGGKSGDSENIKKQLEMLNNKIDRLINILAPNDLKEKSNKKSKVKKDALINSVGNKQKTEKIEGEKDKTEKKVVIKKLPTKKVKATPTTKKNTKAKKTTKTKASSKKK